MQRKSRRRVALLLCALWIAGVEVLPWMHVAMHDRIAPHYHTATGAIVYVAAGEPLPPGAHVHTHVYPAPPAHRDKLIDTGEDRLRAALAHGANSLAHHALAVPVPPPVWTTPLPVDRRPIAVSVAVDRDLVSLDPLAPRSRGPPSAASVST